MKGIKDTTFKKIIKLQKQTQEKEQKNYKTVRKQLTK